MLRNGSKSFFTLAFFLLDDCLLLGFIGGFEGDNEVIGWVALALFDKGVKVNASKYYLYSLFNIYLRLFDPTLVCSGIASFYFLKPVLLCATYAVNPSSLTLIFSMDLTMLLLLWPLLLCDEKSILICWAFFFFWWEWKESKSARWLLKGVIGGS